MRCRQVVRRGLAAALAAGVGLWLAAGASLGAAEAEEASGAGASSSSEVSEPPAEVMAVPYLEDIAEHLYWWYLDEEDLELGDGSRFVFWVRRLCPEMDEADRSEWAEVRIPAFRRGVVVKRPDYVIEETGEAVKGKSFRIVNLFRLDEAGFGSEESEGWRKVELSVPEMLAEIYDRYEERRFPDRELTSRLHRACRRAMDLDVNGREAGDQVMHVAPLSDVANEAWVYLENQSLLLQFTTDREIEAPGGPPDGEDMRVRGYDLMLDTVSTPDEIPGSTEFMTMDQAGRALYNCVVLGKRLIVINPEDEQETPLLREFVVRWAACGEESKGE